MNSSFVFVLVLLLLCSSIKLFSAATTQLDLTTDQNALLAFKNTITWDPNKDAMLAKNWSSSNTTSVCNWIGVSCGIKHQRVISFNISGFGLSGTLPPHLGNLTFLRYLDISFNDFKGTIPYELSRLHRLREIDMGVNSFTGEIPSWFGALPQLQQLRLYNNTFSGEIPRSLFNNNSKLETIDMRFNSLSGIIPEEIGNCSTSLQILSLSYNQLMGTIPYGLFNLSSLREIRFTYNGLSGSLPSDMCNNLPNLTFLSLSANQIEGQIPHNIWKCRVLEILSLSLNRFNGEIPSEIGGLSMLRELYLGYNDFKPGGIPAEFGNLSRLEILYVELGSLTGLIPKQLGNCTSLVNLDFRDSQLTGELPQELAHLPFLEGLGVFNNSMSGSIPSSIFNISTLKILDLGTNQFSGKLVLPWNLNLEELYLSGNEFTGDIPSSITNASMLTFLELSENSFSGSIPNLGNLRFLRSLLLWDNNLTAPTQDLGFLTELTNCRFLEYLAIGLNPLNGILPPSTGNLSASLRWLHAAECNISGVIPSTIGNLSKLDRLFLEGNQLSGSISPTIGNLKQLGRLDLHGNRLQGYIHPNLCQLSNIYDLQLNDNNLIGPIPDCLGDVRSLRVLNLGSNKLNSTIPSDLWNLNDLLFLNLSSNYLTGQISSQVTSMKVMNLLDLSHNQLSGGIPGSIDGCQMLINLSLSNNKLEGRIPPSLGNIRGLGSLDLSNNYLSGSIPESLGGLNFLQYFNVSFNKLEGQIPTGGRFSNFTAQSFFNNSALCGATKFQVPPCGKKNIRTTRLMKLMKYVLPPFISLVIVATIIVLLLMRRRNLKRVPVSVDNSLSVVAWRRISYIELLRGTNAFSDTNLLGRGSFSSVFKSTLSDGLDVAVKVFNLNLERAVRSFDTECEVLSNIRHRNLVQVVGCCSNPEFKALILEYMPNGSLDKWLHSENYCLDLMQSLQIAVDIASALEYLHHGHTFPIVHCDIKPSNVLLDEDMIAHLADFGISKLFDDGETMVQTKTLATIGYAAPEYGSEGKVSTNGDVYSYGILLLEIFTRKKPTEDVFDEEMSLKEWVNEAIQENAVIKVATPDLLASDDQHFCAKEECISSVFILAMKCLTDSPDERINMIETMAALQKIKTKVMAVTTRRQQYALSIKAKQ